MAKEYIEREAAYDTLTKYYHHKTDIQHKALLQALGRVPAVDVRPVVHAHWVDVRQEGVCAWTAECSNCWTRNDIPPVELAHYCPSCGAKMDEEVDNESQNAD